MANIKEAYTQKAKEFIEKSKEYKAEGIDVFEFNGFKKALLVCIPIIARLLRKIDRLEGKV